jgi:hypothetical protein
MRPLPLVIITMVAVVMLAAVFILPGGDACNPPRTAGIQYQNIRLEPASVQGETDQIIKFSVRSSPEPPATGWKYRWNNSVTSWESNGPSASTSWSKPGDYIVSVEVIDILANKTVGDTLAKASIKSSAPLNKLALLQQVKKLGASKVISDFTITKTSAGSPPTSSLSKQLSLDFPYPDRELPINWSGTGFIGKLQRDIYTYNVQGTVSPDGLTLTSLAYAFDLSSPDRKTTFRLDLANIPLAGSGVSGKVQGTALSDALKRLDYTYSSCNSKGEACSSEVWKTAAFTPLSQVEVNFIK